MRSLITFGFMGGIVTCVHIAVGLFCVHILHMEAFWGNLVAFCTGFFLSYYGHRHVTFRSQAHVSHSMPRFFVISAINLVISQMSVVVIVDMAGLSYNLALAVMIVLVSSFGYLAGRFWAFSDGEF
ncbi:GtrA family protein [Fluviibacterium sp. DFM31]|uniref:GtrA family protein n=1 Tax=Meridianimarinicoccus marinus TaxID=3231483 RepID=A0ABV3L6N6_9RHOB